MRPDLRAWFDEVSTFSSPDDRRRRGREFEKFLRDLLSSESLEPRTSFRPRGEEIDGSFVLDGRTYLLEAKWQAERIPASTIYSFKGKVDGKLVGTIGVFISMSGYSRDAVDALSYGKSLNVLLFDDADVRLILSDNDTFTSILRRKLRAAAEVGVVYVPARSERLHTYISRTGEFVFVTDCEISSEFPVSDALVISEGVSDVGPLTILATRIFEEHRLVATIRFVAAHGKVALADLANELTDRTRGEVPLIIVADSEGDIDGTERLLRSRLGRGDVHLVTPHPSLGAWLTPTNALGSGRPARASVAAARRVNLAKLRERDPTFAKFEVALITAARRRSA